MRLGFAEWMDHEAREKFSLPFCSHTQHNTTHNTQHTNATSDVPSGPQSLARLFIPSIMYCLPDFLLIKRRQNRMNGMVWPTFAHLLLFSNIYIYYRTCKYYFGFAFNSSLYTFNVVSRYITSKHRLTNLF